MNSKSPIKLNTKMVAPGSGKIEGAILHDVDTTKDKWQEIFKKMPEAYYLPDGQEFSVEAGKSFVIKTGDEVWLKTIFHQDGKMTGPLVYFEVEHETPSQTLKKSKDYRFDNFQGIMAALLFGAVTSFFLSACLWKSFHNDYALMSERAILVAFSILSFLLLFLSLFELNKYRITVKPTFNDDQKALRILQNLHKTGVIYVPFSGVDREFVKQCIYETPRFKRLTKTLP